VRKLAVAAVSARLLAEAAARDGFEVVALDVFGDVDTRRASRQWHTIDAGGSVHIDGAKFLAALREIARDGAADAWVPGSGFEGDADLIEQGASLLPALGTPAADVRRVRDPRLFFAGLDAAGVAHPPVRFDVPQDVDGWLVKDAHASGGWHIRAARADDPALPAHLYLQREARGTPMSATFIAAGGDACLLGINRLLVRRVQAHPHVYCGVIGPLPVAGALTRRIAAMLRTLAATFGLCGLCSLDFLLDGDEILVLEVNPRPPASLALYPRVADGGVFAAHVAACGRGALPRAAAATEPRGAEIVFARHALTIDADAAQRLAERPGCHDLPEAGAAFTPGDPVCSVEAAGADAAQVEARLSEERYAILSMIEATP
jgi:predicted ATP-grasp superfamily ATP-dependent carboligase